MDPLSSYGVFPMILYGVSSVPARAERARREICLAAGRRPRTADGAGGGPEWPT